MTHLVFVYGSLKYGYWNNDLLAESPYIGEYQTGPHFKMYDGSFPVVVESDDGHRVHGEVYEVDDETLKKLDYLEGHPHFYERIETIVSDGPHTFMAWIYLGRSAANRSDDDLVPPNSAGILCWGGE